MIWGVKILGDGNNSGSSFIINTTKNAFGAIHITVEVNDGQTTVSQGFHCYITAPKPTLGEVFNYDNPDSQVESEMKVGIILVDASMGKSSFSGLPNHFNGFISPSDLGDLVFKSNNDFRIYERIRS